MNTTCKHFFMAALLLSASIMPPLAQASQEPTLETMLTPELQQKFLAHHATDILEQYFEQVMDQLNNIDCLLQDIAYNMSKNASLRIKNKAQTLEKIKALRETINKIRSQAYADRDLQLIYELNVVTTNIILVIQDALKNGLTTFDVKKLAHSQEIFSKSVTIEDIVTHIQRNNTLLQNLESLSNNLGLKWYNKSYRILKTCIVTPAKALALPAYVLGATAASAICLWYYFGGNRPSWLRNKIGYPLASDNNFELDPQLKQGLVGVCTNSISGLYPENKVPAETIIELSQGIEQLSSQQATGWFGQAEEKLFRLINKRYIIGYFALDYGTKAAKWLFPTLGDKIAEKLKKVDNFLMGGAYKDRQVGDIILHSNVTFDDYIGHENAKAYGRMLCEYLQHPEKFDRDGTQPTTGMLLYGDTRTGKSFFIQALQGEIEKAVGDNIGLRLWKVPSSMILKFGIEPIMAEARRTAPCIVVIEEIDLLGLQRVQNAERLSQFMTTMSSCLDDNQLDKVVIVIATTNKKENLEPALCRKGRFGMHIYFDYPTFEERKLYIEKELSKAACNLDRINTDKLARETEGCSFEDLGSFIKETFRKAKIDHLPVSQATLEQSIDEIVREISRNAVSLTEEQKNIAAANLAGAAITNLLLGCKAYASKVTLCDVAAHIEEEIAILKHYRKDVNGKDAEKQEPIEHGKLFVNHDYDVKGIETREDLIKQCKVALAGHIAEELVVGSCGYTYHKADRQMALAIAKSLVFKGLNEDSLSKKKRNELLEKADDLVEHCEKEVKELLEQHTTELNAIIKALIEKNTLSHRELRTLIFGEQDVIEHLDGQSLLSELLPNNNEAL